METFTPTQRFEVSHTGMAELHAARPPWQLLKELVQNSWDEAPEATECRVTIDARSAETTIKVTVSDDGPGFRDITDAWTLMNHTPKRSRPDKRGRYNLGEKEIISLAIEAEIETVGHTVYFPRMGSRVLTPNERQRGTSISMTMPWHPDQAQELEQELFRFLPTDCALFVNRRQVPQREPHSVRSVILPTVLQDGPGQPMRSTRRRTDIQIYTAAAPDGQGWLYELGIPIQPITAPWDVNVLQKVPMPPNRDTVSQSYLTDIYAELLNETHDTMQEAQFGQSWVKEAIQDSRVEAPAIRSTVHGRYGELVAITSSDADANLSAAEAGYQLVNPRSLTPTERQRFREDADIQTTHSLFGLTEPPIADHPPSGPNQVAFAAWVAQSALLANLDADVRFYHEPGANRIADCTADTETPTVRFNTGRLPDQFFKPPYGRREHLEILYHELGHAVAGRAMEHGPKWGHSVAVAASRVSAPPDTTTTPTHNTEA